MADFALWASACETMFWNPGTFMSAYEENRAEAVDSIIENDPVAAAIKSMMNTNSFWSGTATALLNELSGLVGDSVRRSKSWPGSPRALSGRLRRVATSLRRSDVNIIFGHREGKSRTRLVQIFSGEQETAIQSSASVRQDDGFESNGNQQTGELPLLSDNTTHDGYDELGF